MVLHGDTNVNEVELNRNERLILELVRRNDGISRSSLVSQTILNQSSVHRIVDSLSEGGFLNVGASIPQGRGKPSPALTLNPLARYGYGISINSDCVAVSLVDFRGSVVDYQLLDVNPAEPARTLLDIKYHYLETLRHHNIDPRKIAGIGYSMAGFLYASRKYFNPPAPLKNWLGMDLNREISSLFERPVWIENNATTGAQAEAFLGAGLKYDTFGYLSFNYGFGGGIVINGKPFQGAFGNAGEISRIFSPEEGRSRPALGILIERLNAGGIEINGIRELNEKFDPGWPIAQSWVREVTPNLYRAIDAMYAVIDPQAIVLGGELPRNLGEMFLALPWVKADMRWEISAEKPNLMLSLIDGDCAAIGAALTPVRESYFK
ncbi:MAG: hypothetical protein H6R25_4379 [Proteobacteria bacterium]|nr:hypothetical protein [Pseudomonadota bacterium]